MQIEQGEKILWWRWPLEAWYFLTAPAPAPANGTIAQREKARRGRFASVLLFFVIILVLLPIPTALGNNLLLVTLASVVAIDIVALVLNKYGQTTIAGILVIIGMEIGLGVSVFTQPGGFGVSQLPLLDLFVQAECVAVSLLLPASVFVVAIFNSLFFLGFLYLSPIITRDLSLLLQFDANRLIATPITLQIIIAIVTYIWVKGANDAIIRADRAEEISTLEQQKLDLQTRELEQKHQLDVGIQQILQTHVRVANGDFSVRAPLSQDNILWQIARSLNNLLARLQGYNQMNRELLHLREENERLRAMQNNPNTHYDLHRVQEAALSLIDNLKQARAGYAPLQILQSGTIIDTISVELQKSMQKPTKTAKDKREPGMRIKGLESF